MHSLKRFAILVLISMSVLLLCRCCAPKYNLQRTEKLSAPAPLAYGVPNDSQTIEFVTFSGGGTRAMAMGYEVVKNLIAIKYKAYGKDTSTLRDEIDMTSGVSGGSFVSAALGIYKSSEWNDFYKDGVYCNIQKSIIEEMVFKPWNWFRLMSPYFSRTDIAAEFYSKHIFKDRCFGNMFDRPTVYINATLLAQETQLVFTPQFFGYLNSDINNFQIGYACAASSCFPVAFVPVTLKNYNGFVSESSMIKDPKYSNAERNCVNDINQYYFLKMYRFMHDSTNRWIHLADGGIAGNTGIERILDEFSTNGSINKAINNCKSPLKRLIFIIVNADIDVPDKSCTIKTPPNAADVILYTTSTSMDIMCGVELNVLKGKISELWQAAQLANGTDPSLAQLEKPYLIEINSRNINNASLRNAFNAVPTSFDLNTAQLNTVMNGVDTLMANNSEFIRLKHSIANDLK